MTAAQTLVVAEALIAGEGGQKIENKGQILDQPRVSRATLLAIARKREPTVKG